MLQFLPAPVLGAISFMLYLVNTLFWSTPILVFGLVKALLPITPVQKGLSKILHFFAGSWVTCNSGILALTRKVDWQVTGLDNPALKTNDWFLVISNHQSWTDILVLQHVLNRKVPFLKFFLKQELIKVPVLGLAWWALDFPFMKRYSKSYLAKHPEMKGKDKETTRKACEKFRHMPISVMNFVEGTRFTPAKKQRQNSPYQNLLKPKSGGISFVLDALGDQIQNIVDVTVHYSTKNNSFWDFCCGRIPTIKVDVKVIQRPADLVGDYETDKAYRTQFQGWLNSIWQAKDQQLSQLQK